MNKKIIGAVIAILLLLFTFTFFTHRHDLPIENNTVSVQEDGHYTSKEEVAAYLIHFGKLPSNYLTKKEAEALGWIASAGNLWEVSDRASIGGDRFGNREGKLPQAEGRKWYECDIDYTGGRRNAKRLLYSNDGLIYYTEDHYETFRVIKGE